MNKVQQTRPPVSLTQLSWAVGLCLTGAAVHAQEAPRALDTVTVKSTTEAAIKTDSASSAKFTAPLVDTPK